MARVSLLREEKTINDLLNGHLSCVFFFKQNNSFPYISGIPLRPYPLTINTIHWPRLRFYKQQEAESEIITVVVDGVCARARCCTHIAQVIHDARSP